MDKFIDKISSYNLINYLLPGVIFTYILKSFVGIDMVQDGLVENLFIYYFVGMIMSRLGSLLIEPIAQKIKLVSYAPHGKYITASKIDSKIDLLLESNNLYRTFIAGIFVCLLAKAYSQLIIAVPSLNIFSPYLLLALLLTLFLFAYRKQTAYIRKRVEHANQSEVREQEATPV